MSVNKVVFGGETLIDLTGDTIVKSALLSGFSAHDAKGEKIDGECPFDSDTKDANAFEYEILDGKTAYARKTKLTGKMPNNENYSNVINTADDVVVIPVGFHDGSGTVAIDPTEKAKIKPEDIRQGKTILGVEGSMTGAESVTAEAIEVTATMTTQTITPTNTDYFNQVVVKPIQYTVESNAAGGTTYTIG